MQTISISKRILTTLMFGLTLFGAATAFAGAPTTSPKASVEGSLDKAAVRAVVAEHIDEVRECYNIELLEDETLGGSVVVAFTVAPEGHVSEVSIPSSSMPPRFDACVAAAVERWTFPSTTSETAVSYPFILSAG